MTLKKVALYTRVSTDQQSVDNQLIELQSAALRHNWSITAVYTDSGVSGSKALYVRPGGKQLKQAISRREIDLIATWSVDRLGRSLQDLTAVLSELEAKGIDLYLHQQGIDTTTPGGKALFQMMGVFAEFERSMIRERVKAGLARARKANKVLGRPQISDELKSRIHELRSEGKGMRKIASDLSTGVGTVRRVLSETT